MADVIPPVPPLQPELAPLARWLEQLRAAQNNSSTTTGSLYINVKNYGAKGDGITDDSAAIQAALTYATTYGGTVFFPAATYLVNTPLTVDFGTSWSHHGPRACLKGEGSANTRILCTAANKNLLTVGGFGAQYYVDIEGLYFQGPGYVDETGHPAVDGYGTGTALTIQASSWSSIRECVIRGWGTGMVVTDTFSMMMSSCYIASNLQGATFDATIYARPNAITLVSCGIGDNKNFGLNVNLATTFSMHGGSIEQNGIGGSGAFVGGIHIVSGDNGVSPASFTGVYFEGNAGTADVYMDHPVNSGGSSFSGCTFNRLSSTNYVTNNILVNAAAGVTAKVNATGCGFGGFNTYVPNAARPYIATTGAGTPQVTWTACHFMSATETPTISNYLTGAPTKDLMRVIFAGGAGGFTPVMPNTTCPAPGPGQWFEFTTDALVAAGYPGIWVQGVPG